MLVLYPDDSVYFASSPRADLAARKIQRVFDLLPMRMAVNVGKMAACLPSRFYHTRLEANDPGVTPDDSERHRFSSAWGFPSHAHALHL
ncbi:hypothetical protein EVAR_77711_1 [Eumeta japonica]|uniref:Uncharacterized protein n=1 Tax=Eumeta variegata TaxID=151549 RepID=A0A4C1TBQ0_EUMVA|nr:hypothetical protein EVAR_77711_1 [Eumeta japonica]